MRLDAKVKILIPSVISQEDLKVLTLFYQPLLGAGAYTLYLTLYELSNLDSGISNSYSQQDILDLLNIKSRAHLEMRYKLEALGLLVVYENKNDYIYSLKSPLSAKEFLNDTILGAYLQAEIGEERIKQLIQLFRLGLVNLTEYKNVTKPFNEVYEMKDVELLSTGNHLRGTSTKGGTEINYDNFNYEMFLERIPVRYQRAHLFNPVVKSNIQKIAFIYQFDNEDMYHVYINASQSGEMPSEGQLRLQATIYYQDKNKKPLPEIQIKDTNKAKQLDSISPQDIIKIHSKRDNITVDLNTVAAFMERVNVPVGVVNAILINTLKEKDGLLPTYKYLEKVLITWQNNGVATTEDAVNYLERLDEEPSYSSRSKPKVDKSKEPDWLDDYIKEFLEGGSK